MHKSRDGVECSGLPRGRDRAGLASFGGPAWLVMRLPQLTQHLEFGATELSTQPSAAPVTDAGVEAVAAGCPGFQGLDL